MRKGDKTITDQDLLWDYGGEILHSQGMDLERQIPQHGRVNCFDHSVAVALLSLRLARWLGLRVDRRSLIRGALLHDYFLYDWRTLHPRPGLRHGLSHGLRHGGRAAANADRDFGLNAVEADIIRRHMFPLTLTPPRYRESLLVCWADKVCAVREFGGGLWRTRAK